MRRYAFKHEQQRLSVDVPTQHDTTAPTPLAYVTSDIVCGPVCDGVGQAVHSVQCSDSSSVTRGLISVQSDAADEDGCFINRHPTGTAGLLNRPN